MRPILLKGHERAITHVQYNHDGDLIVSTSKDRSPVLWRASDGERIGTYDGHGGTVWEIDINFSSTRLLSGSADNTMKLWKMETGEELVSFKLKAPARTVGFSHGDSLIVNGTDNIMGQPPYIHIYKMAEDYAEQSTDHILQVKLDAKINHAAFGPTNDTVIVCCDDGSLIKLDTETGKELGRNKLHTGSIVTFNYDKDYTTLITASKDHSAKLVDIDTLDELRVYQSNRNINAAVISPQDSIVAIGGGQDAASVTTTSTRSGKFDTVLHHKIFGNELCGIKGHFGPVNSLAWSPKNVSFVSGGEDGYLRLHILPDSYRKQVSMLG